MTETKPCTLPNNLNQMYIWALIMIPCRIYRSDSELVESCWPHSETWEGGIHCVASLGYLKI